MSQGKGNQAPNKNQANQNKQQQQPAAAQQADPAKPKLSPEDYLAAVFTPQQMSEDQQKRANELRKAAKTFGMAILANVKPSADQTASIRKLREITTILVQTISIEEVGQ